MKKTWIRLVWPLTLIGMIAAGCAASSLQIDSQRDPAANFSAYRTYDWTNASRPATEPSVVLDRRIRTAVEDQLAVKGYIRQSRAPDFLIGYRISIEDEALDTFADLSAYRTGGGSGNIVDVFTAGYEQGQLVLEAFDTSRRRPIWSATARAVIDPAQSTDRVDEAVAKMLASFPSR